MILCIIAETTQPVVAFRDISVTVWLVIAYLVIFGSVIAFVAFIYSMKKLPAAIASLYAYINPLVAITGGYYFLHEKLTIHMLWGAVVTLIGVFLVNYSVKKSEKIIAEPEI
jgi:drug/metabolite transporter (DMT)-like permease